MSGDSAEYEGDPKWPVGNVARQVPHVVHQQVDHNAQECAYGDGSGLETLEEHLP